MSLRRVRRAIVAILAALLAVPLLASPAAAVDSVTVTKDGPATVEAGDDITYTIDVTNAGPDPAVASLTDPLPSGLTFVSLSAPGGWSCTTPAVGENGTVTCTNAAFGVGTAQFTLVATATLETAGTTVTNVATVSSTADVDGDDNEASAATTVTSQADMAVTKSGPDGAEAGDDLTYTIEVRNVGGTDAENATLSDPLPSGTTFLSLTAPSGWSCTTPAVGDNGTVSCSNASFATTDVDTFTLVAAVDGGTADGTFVTNQATVDADVNASDENDTSSAATLIGTPASADVGVQKTGPDFAAEDTDVTYALTVTGGGGDAATNVQLADTLPGTMTFVSLAQDSGPTFSCSTPAVGAGGTVTCTIASLASGSTATFTLVGHVPSGTASGTEFTNQATVSADADVNEENGTGSTAFIVAEADLSVAKSGPASADAGDQVAYTITAANAGPDATGATIFDELPVNTTFVSLVQTGGPAFAATTPAAGGTGTVYLTNGGFGPGESASFTLTVAVDDEAPTFAMTNVVEIDGEAPDRDETDNESSVTTAVTRLPAADLSVTKDGPAAAFAGDQLTYTVTVANDGPDDDDVTLTDPLPTDVTFVSLTQTDGPAFDTVVTPTAGNTGVITATEAGFASGATATFEIVVTTDPTSTGGTLSNTATVTGGGARRDFDVADDSDTAETVVSARVFDRRPHRRADLGIAVAAPQSVDVDEVVTVGVRVHNDGPSGASGVTVRAWLPIGIELVDADVRGGSCSSAPTRGGLTRVVCTMGTVGNGGSRSLRLEIRPTRAGRFAVLAGVRSTTDDLRRWNQYDFDRFVVASPV